MIPRNELDKAIELAKKYKVEQFFLVGSSGDPENEPPHDYDFAVKGLPAENFFNLYTELFMALSRDVDLIDLSGEMTKFKSIVLKEGTLIYERKRHTPSH